MSIPEGTKKINILGAGLVFLGLTGGLAIGGLKIADFQSKKEPIVIARPVQSIAADVSLSPVSLDKSLKSSGSQTGKSELVVASKSGKKYHLLNCPGAKTIIESNKVFFQTIEMAKAAGYTAAANCPGLKDNE